MSLLPMADAQSDDKVRYEALKLIQSQNLVGAANNTKWNELISEIREWKDWRPSYRSKWVNGYISGWDVEWYYHLPFPFVGVHWLDIGFYRSGFSIDQQINESKKIIGLITKIGLSYDVSNEFVRVWGYLPKCYLDFGA